MELRHLRYFVAVAEEENVTRAARRLHLSQPPLTRQIQELEDELGVSLFERTGRSIRLTTAGRRFLREARAVLARVERAVAVMRDAATGPVTLLTIGYAPSPTLRFLPQLLLRLRREHPQVRTVLRDLATDAMLEGVRRGELDAAFVVQAGTDAIRDLRFRPLVREEVVVAVAPDHPDAGKPSFSPAEIAQRPLVTLEQKEYSDHAALLKRILGRRMRRVRSVHECDSGASLAAAVATGVGVALVGRNLVESVGKCLAFVPIVPRPQPIHVGIVYAQKGVKPIVTRLAQLAFEHVGR